jgi:hypothetical protein
MNAMAAVLAAALAAGAAGSDTKAKSEARTSLERLKQLAGEWRGTVAEDGSPMAVTYEVTSGGTAVLERLFPGTPHEMLTLYHLDGDDLVLTHYCASGNQPRMRLVRSAGTDPLELAFDYAGGSNIDPATDAHMHSARMWIRGADRLESEWAMFGKGKPAGAHKFVAARVKQ